MASGVWAAPSALRVLQVEGDSMLLRENGDTVLVDTNQRSPIPPGIFGLKHVPLSDPPRVRIVSDNARYTPYECTTEEINVIGSRTVAASSGFTSSARRPSAGRS